jgi:ABC-type Mn2+/Zn2+ transport system ATPase subunit
MYQFLKPEEECGHFFMAGNDNDNNDFAYHSKVAKEMKDVLLATPVSRYGIVIGTRGSGKSSILKELVKKKPYVAVVSFDLINSVKYLVDTIADKVGYDFDDMTG